MFCLLEWCGKFENDGKQNGNNMKEDMPDPYIMTTVNRNKLSCDGQLINSHSDAVKFHSMVDYSNACSLQESFAPISTRTIVPNLNAITESTPQSIEGETISSFITVLVTDKDLTKQLSIASSDEVGIASDTDTTNQPTTEINANLLSLEALIPCNPIHIKQENSVATTLHPESHLLQVEGCPASSNCTNNSDEDDPVICQLCHLKFSYRSDLNLHMSKVHKEKYDPFNPIHMKEENALATLHPESNPLHVEGRLASSNCTNSNSADCLPNTSSKNALIDDSNSGQNLSDKGTSNTRLIDEDDPVICQLCHQKFSYRSNLNLHMLNVHKDIYDPVTCQLCSRIVSTRGNLKRHMRTVHSEGLPFRCPKCGKCFNRTDSLQKHRLTACQWRK